MYQPLQYETIGVDHDIQESPENIELSELSLFIQSTPQEHLI